MLKYNSENLADCYESNSVYIGWHGKFSAPSFFFSSFCDFIFHPWPTGRLLLLGELVEIGMNTIFTE